jgi:hypothetical protein
MKLFFGESLQQLRIGVDILGRRLNVFGQGSSLNCEPSDVGLKICYKINDLEFLKLLMGSTQEFDVSFKM